MPSRPKGRQNIPIAKTTTVKVDQVKEEHKEFVSLLLVLLPSGVAIPYQTISDYVGLFFETLVLPSREAIALFYKENKTDIDLQREDYQAAFLKAVNLGLFPLASPAARLIELQRLFIQSRDGYTKETVFATDPSCPAQWTEMERRPETAKILAQIKDEVAALTGDGDERVHIDINFSDDEPPDVPIEL